MLTVHHLGKSQSERIVWLCEVLGLTYEIKHYVRDPVTSLAPPELVALHPLGTAPVISRLCQSRLSRSKMSPNKWACKYWLMSGAKSNTGPLTGAPEIRVWLAVPASSSSSPVEMARLGSRPLAQLERHLGVRLFHRTTRSMSLTDAGRQFLEAARPALMGMQQALRIARQSQEDIAGPLRIVAPQSVVGAVIWPLLDAFCHRYPQVQPDVHLDDRIGNWMEDRVDVGFRIGPCPTEGVIARSSFRCSSSSVRPRATSVATVRQTVWNR